MRLSNYIRELGGKSEDIADYLEKDPRNQPSALDKQKTQKADELIVVLKRDCNKFINELKKCSSYVFRSVHQDIGDLKLIQSRLDDRTPKDTPKEVHNYVNSEFEKKFGWPVRNGVFTSGRRSFAYGTPYLFFPRGQYRYTWSPVIDDFYQKCYSETGIFIPKFLKKKYENEIKDYGFSNSTWYINGKEVDEYDIPYDIKQRLYELFFNSGDLDISEIATIKERGTVYGMRRDTYDEWVKRRYPNIETMNEIIKKYKRTDLPAAVRTHNEIIFNCKDYWLVNEKYMPDISIRLLGWKSSIGPLDIDNDYGEEGYD
jgi:hypothetical protein